MNNREVMGRQNNKCQFSMAPTDLDSPNLTPSRLSQSEINTHSEEKN